jgi:hypothetical protein
LKKKIYDAAKKAQCLVYKYAGTLMNFVGFDTCSRLIWTQGSSVRTTYNVEANVVVSTTKKVMPISPIGFFNMPHFDTCDKMANVDYMELLKELEDKSPSTPTTRKIRSMGDSIAGMGLPTVCAYNIISSRERNVQGWFADLFFCSPILNGSLHYFCGWAIPHGTCIPVAIKGDVLQTLNKGNDDDIFIAAWGSSGGSPHVREERERRRTERLLLELERIAERIATKRSAC